MTTSQVKLMLVDDSRIIVEMLERIISHYSGIEVVAKAYNGQEAIEKLNLNNEINLVLLDIQMPIMDGLSTIPKLLEINPKLKIIVVSSLAVQGAKETVQALTLGAADFLEKPQSQNELEKFNLGLMDKIKNFFPQVTENSINKSQNLFSLRKRQFFVHQIIAIACSTGGPRALMELFGGFSPEFLQGNIIVVTQHIRNEFIDLLLENINSIDKIHAKKAENGEILKRGFVYFAPADNHLEIKKFGIMLRAQLSQSEPENFCRPSADPMFRSIAQDNINCIAIILTGIGKDGLAGAKELDEKNSLIIAQDKETSVVWGMPGEVANAGICSAVLPLQKISHFVEKGLK